VRFIGEEPANSRPEPGVHGNCTSAAPADVPEAAAAALVSVVPPTVVVGTDPPALSGPQAVSAPTATPAITHNRVFDITPTFLFSL
jgi:hypothetical protein